MTEDLGTFLESEVFEFVFDGSAFTTSTPSNLYVQLHTGPPGNDGTANTSDVDREETDLTDWNISGSGPTEATNGTTIEIEGGSSTDTITHASLWDSASGGTHYMNGTLADSIDFSNVDRLDIEPGDATFEID